MANQYLPIPTTQSVTPGTSGSPGVISRDGELTIVLSAGGSTSSIIYVQLPSGCSVGDIVEVYCPQDPIYWSVFVMPPSGETFCPIVTGAGNHGAVINNRFRKISSTQWGMTAPLGDG